MGRSRRLSPLVVLLVLGLAVACTDATEGESAADPGPPPTSSAPGPANSPPTTDAEGRCPAAGPDDVGFAPGGWWVFEGAEQQAADLDAMVAHGARWLRIGFQWQIVSPAQGVYDWERWDRIVALAAERCLSIIGLPTYTAEWARIPECRDAFACRPHDPDDYGTYVADLAARYGDEIGVWELWNEPNVAQFFGPRPDPGRYAALLRAGTRAVRAADPGAVVLSAGLAPVRSTDDGRRLHPADFLHGVIEAGGLAGVDGVAFHPYGFPALPDESTGRNGWADQLPDVLDVLDDADLDVAIWLTEYGIPTGASSVSVSPDDQAAAVRLAFSLWRSDDRFGPLVWYAFRDAGDDARNAEDNFGILRRDGTPKTASPVFAEEARSG